MGLNRIMKFFVYRFAMVLLSFAISVSSECSDPLKSCPHGPCSDECENTTTSSGTGVEVIVAIMSVSVALILGLGILLVYVCLKQGPWTSNAPSNENTSCESTSVEIPEYLMRRRFSSLSMTSGPPPYFSLFSFSLNGVGEMRSTVIGENVTTENPQRLPSVDQPPEYGVLFGHSPPPYERVVKTELQQSVIVGPIVSANTGF